MFTLDEPPTDYFREAYNFTPDDAWQIYEIGTSWSIVRGRSTGHNEGVELPLEPFGDGDGCLAARRRCRFGIAAMSDRPG